MFKAEAHGSVSGTVCQAAAGLRPDRRSLSKTAVPKASSPAREPVARKTAARQSVARKAAARQTAARQSAAVQAVQSAAQSCCWGQASSRY
jgi:hypothetical protein